MTTATHTRNGKASVIGDRQRKPTIHPVDRSAIHDGLHSFDRWLGWRWTWNTKAAKWDKPPIEARTGKAGSSTNRATWCSFDTAIAAQKSGRVDGVGFALGKADCDIHFAGVDLDDCRNKDTGELSEVARDIIATMNTYTEVSPSETGVKLLCIGKLPAGAGTKNKARTVEVYSGGRYFTITGRRIDGTPKRVEARQEQLTAVWQKYIGSEQVRPERTASASTNGYASNGHISEAALAAMLRHKPDGGESDGSKRLFAVCCRAVEYDLADDAAVATVRKYEATHPFPAAWTDEEILRRLRDAERRAERGTAVVIANYRVVEVEDDKGEKKNVNVPRTMVEIIDDINHRMGGWPRRIDNVLFVDDPEHGIDWFDRRTTAGLFGWLRRHNKVQWTRGGSFVGQAELFAEIERTAQRYEAIEVQPHEPPIDGIYYRGAIPPVGDGQHLRKLLDRFRPETTIDRDLIQAAMMTAFWGGLPGCRPAFVVTSDDGRGVGKSKVPEVVGYLCGGFIDVSAGEDIETLKTRMLTPGARTKRIALLDNVKSLRLSWAELEAMITSPVISGKQMYVGEGQRPNLLTWFVTLNGVSMATDMAQRSVIIKVVKGKNDGPWWEETRQFIDQHRQQIIGDIIGALRGQSFPLAEFTRWATWEQHVLSRLPEPGDAQRLILDRQGEANCELDEAEIIEEHFAEQLRRLDYDPQTAQVRIPVAVAARWYGWAVGEPTKTASVTRKLKQLADEGHLNRIAPDSTRTYGRAFIWTGKAADVIGQPIENDLADRIARMMDAKDT
jgi:hypothetical protein